MEKNIGLITSMTNGEMKIELKITNTTPQSVIDETINKLANGNVDMYGTIKSLNNDTQNNRLPYYS